MDEGLLNDLLECSVCLERLDTSSRVLPCQHTFCIKCLKEIVHSHKELRCPECRVLVEIRVEDLPPNVLLMRILEGMRGTHRPQQQVVPTSTPALPLHHHLHNLHHHQPHYHHQHHQPQQPQVAKQHQNMRHQRMQVDPAPGFTYSSGQGDGGKQAYVIPATTPHARAVYDYLSKEPSDLSFKKGDVIILRKRIDTHWYQGESGGKQGAFPITYAQIIVPLPPAVPHCKALYDFRMAPPDEEGCLAFDKGAMIVVIRRVDENWAEGKLDNRIGIFPIAFVEMNAPARSLMKLSSNSAAGSSRVAPPTPPADGSKPPQLTANPNTNSSNVNTPTRQVHPSSIIQSVQLAQQRANAAGYRPAIQIQQLHNAFRQQHMSVSSPVPAPASQRNQQNMSQSHPNYLHQQSDAPSQPVPRLQTGSHEASQQSVQNVDSGEMYDWSVGHNRNLENPYTTIASTAMLDNTSNQNTQVAKATNTSQENQGQSSSTDTTDRQQQSYQNSNKSRGNVKQFTNLSSSYHATNNLSSDSSSTTTTASFGGSSVTTTPNTSSSNTSSASESNTPSSPASPAYSSQGRTTTLTTVTEANNTLNTNTVDQTRVCNQYYNAAPGQIATPQRSTPGHAREDADTPNDVGNNPVSTANLSNSGSPLLNSTDINNRSNLSCNNSPIQNVSNNATPPRSNMSSPQTLNQVSNANQSSAETGHGLGAPQHHHDPVTRHHGLIYQNVPFSNSGYTLMSNASAPNVPSVANPFINAQMASYGVNEHSLNASEAMQGLISPRHGRDGPLVSVPRSSHGYHHRDKEKRHSLTPGGPVSSTQQTSHNRHSAEILSPTSGNLLDLEPPSHNHSTSKRDAERERHGNHSGDGRDHQDRGERASGDKREREKDRDKHKKRSGSADRQSPAAYIALYPYKPQKADELELKKGGVYMVLERCQDGWYKGCSNRTQKCGVFPGNYVAPASKSLQSSTASSSSPRTRHQGSSTQTGSEPKTSGSGSTKWSNASTTVQSASSSSASTTKTHVVSESLQASSSPHFQLQPPDLPPRSISPGASNASPSSGFSWSITPKSSSSSKSGERSKDKSKTDKSTLSGGVSIMKRLAAMKKCRSPPPSSSGFSMDNPVFEDCTPSPSSTAAVAAMTAGNLPGEPNNGATHHPVHVRSGSCPSQLLEGAPPSSNLGSQPELRSNRPQALSPQPHPHPHHHQQQTANVLTSGGSVSSAVAHRLFPAHHLRGSGSQTLGPSQAGNQRRHSRPSVFNATLAGDPDQVAASASLKPGYATGRTSGDVPWLPVSTRHNHHRKSHSLDAGHQMKPGKESSAPALRERFRCIVAYPPNSEYELELRVDDIVMVHRKWGDGWYKGTLERTGRTGLFPASFVEAC